MHGDKILGVSIVDEILPPPSTCWICCFAEALAAEFHWSDTFQGRAPLAEACNVDSAHAYLYTEDVKSMLCQALVEKARGAFVQLLMRIHQRKQAAIHPSPQSKGPARDLPASVNP